LVSVAVYPQTNYDSVILSLSNSPDSVKIVKLNALSLKLRGQDPKLAIRFALTAKEIAEKTGNRYYLAESTNLLGVIYRNLGDLTTAMQFHQQALKIANEAKNLQQIAYCFNNISVVHREACNYSLAFDNAIKAVRIFDQVNNLQGLAYAYINIGNIFTEQKIYPEAIKYFNKTLKIRKKQNDWDGTGQALGLIAHTYTQMNDFKEALSTFFETEKIYNQTKNKRGLAQTWNGIARVLALQKFYSDAIEYRQKALSLFEELDYIDQTAITNGHLGILYAKTDNLNLGRKYIAKARNLKPKINSAETKIELDRMTGEFYENAGLKDSALFYYKEFMRIKDSIQYNSNVSKFAETEALYLNEKAIRENLLLSQNVEANKRQTIYLVLIVTLMVILAVFIYYRFRSVRETNKKLNELNAMKDTFFRIIAHDLKSPFNAVFGYLSIMKGNLRNLPVEEIEFFINSIDGAISKSYQLLEQLLLWSRSNTGKLEFHPAELNLDKIIGENINLLTPVAQQKQIMLEYVPKPDISVLADEAMLKTVIRNLVSNSIKFTQTGGTVQVIAERNKSLIKIRVKDNGVGMTEEQKNNLFRIDKSSSTTGTKGEQGTGLGLIICREFIEKHKGKISVESKKGEGTSFILSFPV
jgi:signal transduction histidine kinase